MKGAAQNNPISGDAAMRRQHLREVLAELQEESIDTFVAWWERYLGDRTEVQFERKRRALRPRLPNAIGQNIKSAAQASELPEFDLAAFTPYWQDQLRLLLDRLPELPVIECGPVFSLDVNAFPRQVEDVGYLILLHQGWLQLYQWMAQTMAVIDCDQDPISELRAQRRFRSLPILACGIMGDDSLHLSEWLPEPLYDLSLEHPAIVSYVTQAESFILLHEISHILLGHLEALESHRGQLQAGEMAALQCSWEFEADSLAVELLLCASPSGHVDEWALCALFWLLHTAEQYSIFQYDSSEKTHPPAADRLERVLHKLQSRQQLRLEPDLLVGISRSLEPERLILEEKPEDDVRPWRILDLQIIDDILPDR